MKPTVLKTGVRFECQGSGRCCVSRGGYGFVYLSKEDRRALAKQLNLTTSQFTRRYCTKTEGWFHLREQGKDCVFLEGSRCRVYEARPTQCRTWPFWPENMNARAWNRDVLKFCPGVGKGKWYSPQEISALVKQDEKIFR